MKLTSLLAAGALTLGGGAAWAANSVISNLALPSDAAASDLSTLMFPSSGDGALPSAIAISLGGGFSLSNIRITVLDSAAVPSASMAEPGSAVLLDQALSGGNAYFFQVKGSALAIDVAVTPVPEPGTTAMMLAGLALVARQLRRRLR